MAIYFIWSELAGKVRIGSHPDPWTLLNKMQPHHGGSLRLLPVKHGGPERAAKIADRFAKERRIGDWYYLSDRLQAFIYNNTRQLVSADDGALSIREAAAVLSVSRATVHRAKRAAGLEQITTENIEQLAQSVRQRARRGVHVQEHREGQGV